MINMMNEIERKGVCPKDANDYNKDECCAMSETGYMCSRIKGHKGKHHAHDHENACLQVW